MIDLNVISSLITEIKKNDVHLCYDKEFKYNPMEFFYQRVSEKEICHSKVIADLLNPKGTHCCGNVFLDNFMKSIDCPITDNGQDFKISIEKHVQRSLTSGNGLRRIDILIEWKDKISNRKNAVIVENKLNNAHFQEKQVEDYIESMHKQKYYVRKCVILSDNIIERSNSKYKYMYCHDLVKWLETCEKIIKNEKILYSYIQLLRRQSYKKEIIMDAKKLLDLSVEDMNSLIDLVNCYNTGMVRARGERVRDLIEELLMKEDTSIEFEYVFKTPYMQIWSEKDYDDINNKLWVEVYFYDKKTIIKIASDRTDTIDFSQENSCLSNYIQDGDSNYYIDNNILFTFPNENSDRELSQKVFEILKAVTSFRKSQHF